MIRSPVFRDAVPLRRLPQAAWNLGCASLVLLALPLLCCAMLLPLRVRLR